MISFPNCKINLGLSILSKRKDGFHNLETVFYPVKLCDAVEIISTPDNTTTITVTGIEAGNAADNLCNKAYQLLKKDYPQIDNIHIHLHKQIPAGAGLGGGSADAAFTLKLLCKKFNLDVSEQNIFKYALLLGSDCPFFLYNQPCLATGRGEVLAPINLSLKNYKILLANPGIHISTAEAFENIQPAAPQKTIKKIISQPIETWKSELANDFENFVFAKYAAVKKIKEDLYNAGALYASMSGSGSTVFGIFEKNSQVDYKPSMFYKTVNAS